jgi:hypothetical protein
MTERLDPYEVFAEDDVDLDYLLGLPNRRHDQAEGPVADRNGEVR